MHLLTRDRLSAGILLLLLALSFFRVHATYRTFTQTIDEPFHIAAGMEWLDRGIYRYEHQHPPLARILVALGPYINGLRSFGKEQAVEEGTAILFTGGRYWDNLALARLGTLPFLILSAALIYLWGRRWFGRMAGLSAVFLFLQYPPVLGHAGLATTDMACTAAVVFLLYRFFLFIELPGMRQSIWLAVSLAFAVLAKFSALLFALPCMAAAWAYLYFTKPEKIRAAFRPPYSRKRFPVIFLVAFFLVWAGYRFSLEPLLSTQGTFHLAVKQKLSSYPVVGPIAYSFLLHVPIPCHEIISGLHNLAIHQQSGHPAFFLGEYRLNGWYSYFPVLLVLRTPLGFLLLFVPGIVLAYTCRKSSPYTAIFTFLFPAVILAVCLPSRINIGFRHVLPLVPFMALACGYVASFVWQKRKTAGRLAVILCLAAAMGESIAHHPDYLAYFNPLAGQHPENIVCDSDLDWGQDLHRLSARLSALGRPRVGVCYFGNFPLEKSGLTNYYVLSADQPVSGYVAVSAFCLHNAFGSPTDYGWLRARTPRERIGKSIFLYDLP